ncbi:MAG TPA: DUF2171 domain-containing protein [Gaiellaceae bacterium]|nr:DUF2171 domain-containing protein [Gaiellaceae bacterium]
MADPASWLSIEPGWRVDAADGTEVGRVEEVTGDSNADIFDGLAISFSLLGKQHYVPSEQVGEITQGAVRLKLDRAAIQRLPEFDEPAEEIEVEPEAASRRQRLETREVLRPKAQAHRVTPLRRALEWLGLAGRR